MTVTTLEGAPSSAVGPRQVGDTGVVVSPIGLDGAVFGWASGIDETVEVLDLYSHSGGNFISTADHYAGGRSEIMIGSWLQSVPDRGSVILATGVGRHPDAAGLSRRSILRAVENSLARLGTDYIDFLSFDGEDASVPVEESLETAEQLIRQGKVRFLSVSEFSVPRIEEVAEKSAEAGTKGFRASFVEYNLMRRTPYESELQPLAVALGRGAFAKLPLANGFLTGQFRTRDDVPQSILFEGATEHIGRRGSRVLEALDAVAKELDQTPTRVALAWVLLKPGIAATVLRARGADQLRHSLGATDVRLARHHVALLDRASA
jgi:aryl-alcohol dehydrogenase-like predicted oxidoreductase